MRFLVSLTGEELPCGLQVVVNKPLLLLLLLLLLFIYLLTQRPSTCDIAVMCFHAI